MVTDCSGAFVWAYKQLGETIYHGSNTIWKKHCSSRGKLSGGKRADGQPVKFGTAVFLLKDGCRHHIGLYVGNDVVIEAKSTYYGVVTSHLSHWDEWGELAKVDYTDADEDGGGYVILKKGSKGEAVRMAQEALNEAGFDCGTADGIFGQKTESAVKAFQEEAGLDADGVIGEKTWEALGFNWGEKTDIPPAEADEILSTDFNGEDADNDNITLTMTREQFNTVWAGVQTLLDIIEGDGSVG